MQPHCDVQCPERVPHRNLQARIRNRSSIMARHMFADADEGFVHSQVNALLASLHIEPTEGADHFHPTSLHPEGGMAEWAAEFGNQQVCAPATQQTEVRRLSAPHARRRNFIGGPQCLRGRHGVCLDFLNSSVS